MIGRLRAAGRVHVSAVYDVDRVKRHGAAAHFDVDRDLRGPEDVIEAADVVLVLTSMNEHGPPREGRARGRPARARREADGHLAAGGGGAPRAGGGRAPCPRLRPHTLLSPTFRAVHGAVRAGEVGDLLTARARYGWAGPWWNEWFYAPGGGSLFDLGVYNVTSLCALFGPARRVTAMVGVAIPEREVNGRRIRVEADDNAHVLLDFSARFAVVTTGFTMQRYRSPAIEVYGSEGTVQLLGDDWAPEGWELWRNGDGAGASSRVGSPLAVDRGLRHLVECVEAGRPTVTRPEHAYHALEVMLAAQAAGRDGVARSIESGFPDPVYDSEWVDLDAERRAHDRRSHDGL